MENLLYFPQTTANIDQEYDGGCKCHYEDANLLKTSCVQPGMGYNTLLFLSLIDVIMKSPCSLSDPCRRVKSTMNTVIPKHAIDEYDFIVVGGGVGGTVVAARLSENPNHTVHLLEAGPEEPTITSVPAFAFSAINTTYDWQYKTMSQKNACLSSDGVCLWPRGKMLCGTACLSGMMYTRGNPKIYNKWAELGNKGWSYDELLPYFKKSENNTQPLDEIEQEYHGFNGPLPVNRYSYMPELGYRILSAARELGYRVADLNGHNQTGFTIASIMTQNGILMNPSKSFLLPVLHRKNLRVSVDSLVMKIIFDETNSKATGVEYIDKYGVIHTIYARKEIILSGGVIGSPQLLLLSGIGPADHLRSVGIKPRRDLPVGQNLHYHVGLTIQLHVHHNNDVDVLTIDSVRQYLRNHTGPLSSTGLTQITAFVESSLTQKGFPDLQIYLDGFTASCNDDKRNNNTIVAVNFRPIYLITKCRGYLKLRSSDPFEKPDINPNYLCDEREIEALVDAVKIVEKMTETKSMRQYLVKFDVDANEQCASLKKHLTMDQYWRCVIIRYTNGENHHAGTCKMGSIEDSTTVIDSELRVHGIPNLRVIDASVFPTPINCNTIAPTIMIAEKGSDMIKATWNYL